MEDQIARWGELVGVRNASEPSNLVGLFQDFRPDGAGVEKVFEAMPFGDEVLNRVKGIYECTSAGFKKTDVYFIPRPLSACPEPEARKLIAAHFTQLRQIALDAEEAEISDLLDNTTLTRVPTLKEIDRQSLTDESPEAWIYDMITDYFWALTPQPSPLLLLRDAMYGIANDIFLRNFLLWPMYEKNAPHPDPFRPYYNLWCRGISYAFHAPDDCRFFIAAASR